MKKVLLILIVLFNSSISFSQISEEQEILIPKIKRPIKDLVFDNQKLQHPATFKTGDKGLFNFYKKKSVLEVNSFEIPEKSTYFRIYINEKGKAYKCEIIKSPDKKHSNEINRLIKLLPLWNPAKKGNRNVKAVVFDHITFN